MLDDDAAERIRAHPGVAEVVMKLSATARFGVDSDGDYPVLYVTDGPVTILLMPFGASEGGFVNPCDITNGSDLVLAASMYRSAISEAHAKQTGAPLPQRRAARRFVDRHGSASRA